MARENSRSRVQIFLKTSTGTPAENIGALCSGNSGKNSISQILAEKINAEKFMSDTNGLLILKRSGTEIYGSYRYIGPFRFGSSSTPLGITCNLIYRGASIHRLELQEPSSPTTITLKI